jgi:cytidylate kinase
MTENNFHGSRIIISGLTAAGKTTHAKLLEKKFGFKYISASNTLLELMGVSSKDINPDFWASQNSKELSGLRGGDRSFDRLVDQTMSEIIANNENIVVDSWAASWLSKENALRIWLDSSLNSRIWKSMVSHGLPKDRSYEAYNLLLTEKDNITRKIFLEEYGFDLFKDHEHFDLIIDITDFITDSSFTASKSSVESVDEIIVSIVGLYLQKENMSIDKVQKIMEKNDPAIFKKVPNW